MPKIDLFTALRNLINEYPSPPSLRGTLLAHLYALLLAALPNEPQAVKLRATRALTPGLVGEALVEAIRVANEELLRAVQAGNGSEAVSQVYADFVDEWCRAGIDENLVGRISLSSSLYLDCQSFNRCCCYTETLSYLVATLAHSANEFVTITALSRYQITHTEPESRAA